MLESRDGDISVTGVMGTLLRSWRRDLEMVVQLGQETRE